MNRKDNIHAYISVNIDNMSYIYIYIYYKAFYDSSRKSRNMFEGSQQVWQKQTSWICIELDLIPAFGLKMKT